MSKKITKTQYETLVKQYDLGIIPFLDELVLNEETNLGNKNKNIKDTVNQQLNKDTK